jgi:two-component system sensor histidine kinase TctE
MTRNDSSLFTRLAVLVSLVLCVGATALASAAWYYARAAADDAYDRVLKGAALQMADSLTVDGGEMIVDLPASAFELLGPRRARPAVLPDRRPGWQNAHRLC